MLILLLALLYSTNFSMAEENYKFSYHKVLLHEDSFLVDSIIGNCKAKTLCALQAEAHEQDTFEQV